MSRIGKQPVTIPSGVDVTIEGQNVAVKGPKGTLNFRAHDDVEVAFGNGELSVKPRHETARARALWGTTRAVLGAPTQPYTQQLLAAVPRLPSIHPEPATGGAP